MQSDLVEQNRSIFSEMFLVENHAIERKPNDWLAQHTSKVNGSYELENKSSGQLRAKRSEHRERKMWQERWERRKIIELVLSLVENKKKTLIIEIISRCKLNFFRTGMNDEIRWAQQRSGLHSLWCRVL